MSRKPLIFFFFSLLLGAHMMAYDEAEAKLSAASPLRLSAALRLAHFYAEKVFLKEKRKDKDSY